MWRTQAQLSAMFRRRVYCPIKGFSPFAREKTCSAGMLCPGAALVKKKGLRFPASPCFSLVPGARLELARCCHRRILSPLRLPIPPSRHEEILSQSRAEVNIGATQCSRPIRSGTFREYSAMTAPESVPCWPPFLSGGLFPHERQLWTGRNRTPVR